MNSMSITEIRTLLAVSTRELARAAGIPRTSLCKMERDLKRSSGELIFKAVEALRQMVQDRIENFDAPTIAQIDAFLANPLGLRKGFKEERGTKEGSTNDFAERMGEGSEVNSREPRALAKADCKTRGNALDRIQPNRARGGQSDVPNDVKDSSSAEASKRISEGQTELPRFTEQDGNRGLISSAQESEACAIARTNLLWYQDYSPTLKETLAEVVEPRRLFALSQVVTQIRRNEMDWSNLQKLAAECKLLPAGHVNIAKTVLAEIAANLPTLFKPDDCSDFVAYARAKLSPSRSGFGVKRVRTHNLERRANVETLCVGISREFHVHANNLKKSTQDTERSLLDLRGFLEDWYKIEANRARVFDAFKKDVSFGTLYRICCENIQTDAYEIVREYFADYVGYNAEYAGQIVGADGTGFNQIKIVSERNGRFEKRQFLIFVDDASGYVWAWNEVTNSEVEAWPRALNYFLNNARFAPEVLLCDRIGGLAESLRYLKPGLAADQIKNSAVLLLLSAGTQFIVHKPGNPRGKARTEAGVKQFKRSIVREIVKRARSMDLVGQVEKRGYEFEDSQELAKFIIAGTQACNGREIRGAGRSRHALLNLETASARRQSREITSNLSLAQNRVLQDAYVSRLHRGTIKVSEGGVVADARLLNIRSAGGSSSDTIPSFSEQPIILSVPKGVLATDEKKVGEYHVILIEPRRGQPQFYFAEAQKIARNEYGELTHKDSIGTYSRIADTQAQAARRSIQKNVSEEEYAREEKRRALAAAASGGKIPGEVSPVEIPNATAAENKPFLDLPSSRCANQKPLDPVASVAAIAAGM